MQRFEGESSFFLTRGKFAFPRISFRAQPLRPDLEGRERKLKVGFLAGPKSVGLLNRPPRPRYQFGSSYQTDTLSLLTRRYQRPS